MRDYAQRGIVKNMTQWSNKNKNKKINNNNNNNNNNSNNITLFPL